METSIFSTACETWTCNKTKIREKKTAGIWNVLLSKDIRSYVSVGQRRQTNEEICDKLRIERRSYCNELHVYRESCGCSATPVGWTTAEHWRFWRWALQRWLMEETEHVENGWMILWTGARPTYRSWVVSSSSRHVHSTGHHGRCRVPRYPMMMMNCWWCRPIAYNTIQRMCCFHHSCVVLRAASDTHSSMYSDMTMYCYTSPWRGGDPISLIVLNIHESLS